MKTLSINRSKMYRAGYKHLDDWEDIGEYEEYIGEPTEDDGESKEFPVIARVESDESHDTVVEALQDMAQNACTCEHDCCGHWFEYARAFEWIDPTHVKYTIAARRNV